MKSIFIDKKCCVLIAHPTAAIRMKIQQTLKSIGFTEFETCANMNEARRTVKSRTIDWLLTPLFASDKESAIKFLSFLAKEKPDAKVLVSLFLNEEENSVIPYAAELGMLSYHRSYFETDSLRSEFATLINTVKRNNFDPCLVAASYLRIYLYQQKKTKTLMQLGYTISKTYPNNVEMLVHFAESQALNGRVAEASATLTKAKLLDPSLAKDVSQFLPAQDNSAVLVQESLKPIFELETVLIIDPDVSSKSAIKNVLLQLNVSNVLEFSDGQTAWEWIRTAEKIDLIIMEWKLPQLTGPLLIQRIRSRDKGYTPIVISSSLVKEDDSQVLEEFSVSKIMPKPVDSARLMKVLNWCTEQEKNPQSFSIAERKIISNLANRNVDEALHFKKMYQANPEVPIARKLYIDAEFHYYFGNYAKAKQSILEAVRIGKKETLQTTNFLGRCLLQLGDYSAALHSFHKAQAFSANNIERICHMAQANVMLGDLEEADENIAQAEKLDSKNQNVEVAKAARMAAKNGLSFAYEVISGLNDGGALIAFLNNHAVAKTRSGSYKQGIELYQSVLSLLPANEAKHIARISYNLGLAFVRSNDLKGALNILKIARDTDPIVRRKASSLFDRVKVALETGSPVNLNAASNDVLEDLEISFDSFDVSSGGGSSPNDAALTPPLCLRSVFSFRDEFEGLSAFLKE